MIRAAISIINYTLLKHRLFSFKNSNNKLPWTIMFQNVDRQEELSFWANAASLSPFYR